MAALNRREFARVCFEEAARFGVNAHYLIAVAQLRSGINDDTNGAYIGPFRFTPDQWDQALERATRDIERLHVAAPRASANDITSWRIQCQVFAAITADIVWPLVRKYGRFPEAGEIYCAELSATDVEFDNIAQDFGRALDSTAPLLAEVISELSNSEIMTYQAKVPEKTERTQVSAPARKRDDGYVTPLSQGVKSGLYRVWYGTNRRLEDPSNPENGYSSEPDTKVHHGYCTVFVPASHIIGNLGSAWWSRLLRGVDDRLRLISIKGQKDTDFWEGISQQLRTLGEFSHKHAVIFVHGYNVSFQEAALRAAQIGYDLSIEGPMGFFSWPSQGRVRDYPVDEDVIEQSEGPIADFITDFATKSGANRVHIIAHSMGNRGLLRAVNRIAARAERESGVPFGQVVLAAADVNANTFRSLCGAYSQVAKRTTLYVSEGDLTIGASVWLHKFPRVGLLPPVFVTPGIDTINATNVDLSFLGHGYVAEARSVLVDMYQLFASDAPPERRFGLRRDRTDTGETYWSIGK